MISLDDLTTSLATSLATSLVDADRLSPEYCCQTLINLYDSPTCDRLATQAAQGRHLRFVIDPSTQTIVIDKDRQALSVQLCEDEYPGWLAIADLPGLAVAPTPYQAPYWTEAAIQEQIPAVIAFTHAAMAQPNVYLWGGTVSPNYDCSGLMQAAFASVGIWLPRDAYQQEAFLQPCALEEAQPGYLIFFGNSEKTTHVGLYLGNGAYIHSSGVEQGRNGIGIDVLSEDSGRVSELYYAQRRGAGKVVASYLSA